MASPGPRQLRAPGPTIPARQRSPSGPAWTAPSGPITAGRADSDSAGSNRASHCCRHCRARSLGRGGQRAAVGRDRAAFPAHDPHRVGVVQHRSGQVGLTRCREIGSVGHSRAATTRRTSYALLMLRPWADQLEEAQPQPSLDAVGDRLGVGRHRRPGVADHGRGPGGQLLAGQRELRGFGQIVLRADAARRWLGAGHREPRPVLHGAPFDVRLPLRTSRSARWLAR